MDNTLKIWKPLDSMIDTMTAHATTISPIVFNWNKIVKELMKLINISPNKYKLFLEDDDVVTTLITTIIHDHDNIRENIVNAHEILKQFVKNLVTMRQELAKIKKCVANIQSPQSILMSLSDNEYARHYLQEMQMNGSTGCQWGYSYRFESKQLTIPGYPPIYSLEDYNRHIFNAKKIMEKYASLLGQFHMVEEIEKMYNII